MKVFSFLFLLFRRTVTLCDSHGKVARSYDGPVEEFEVSQAHEHKMSIGPLGCQLKRSMLHSCCIRNSQSSGLELFQTTPESKSSSLQKLLTIAGRTELSLLLAQLVDRRWSIQIGF